MDFLHRGGVRGFFFDGEETETTTTATSYVGTTRTAREYVMVDLGSREDARARSITVRITDEHTGRQAERSIAFNLDK